MSDQLPYHGLGARERRRVLVGGLLRAGGMTVVLGLVYFLAPMDRDSRESALLMLVLLVVGIALLIAWEARRITTSDYPYLRGVEALAVVVPLYLLGFSTVYFLMSEANRGSFSEPLTRLDSLYFVVTIFGTVGFGDITGTSEAARAIVVIQIIGDLVLIAVGLKLLLAAAKRGQERLARVSMDDSEVRSE